MLEQKRTSTDRETEGRRVRPRVRRQLLRWKFAGGLRKDESLRGETL